VHRLRVRYSECDAQGVLFNAHYLAYIDHTITELWRAAYGGYQVMLDRGVDIVVAEVRDGGFSARRGSTTSCSWRRRSPTSGTTSMGRRIAFAGPATMGCC